MIMLRQSFFVALVVSLTSAIPLIEPRQFGAPPGLVQIFSTTTNAVSTVKYTPNVFTSYRVITQPYVVTVPSESTIYAGAGSTAVAGLATPAVPTQPAATPATTAAPLTRLDVIPSQATTAAGAGLLGLGNLASAVIQATATIPVANVAATVCLGLLVDGVCQSGPVPTAASPNAAQSAATSPAGLAGLGNAASAIAQATASVPLANAAGTVCLGVNVAGICQPSPAATGNGAITPGTGGNGGQLGNLATLPGAVLTAGAGLTVTPGNVAGVTLPTVAATAGICLGIFTNGVCQPSNAAAASPTGAAGLPGLSGVTALSSLGAAVAGQLSSITAAAPAVTPGVLSSGPQLASTPISTIEFPPSVYTSLGYLTEGITASSPSESVISFASGTVAYTGPSIGSEPSTLFSLEPSVFSPEQAGSSVTANPGSAVSEGAVPGSVSPPVTTIGATPTSIAGLPGAAGGVIEFSTAVFFSAVASAGGIISISNVGSFVVVAAFPESAASAPQITAAPTLVSSSPEPVLSQIASESNASGPSQSFDSFTFSPTSAAIPGSGGSGSPLANNSTPFPTPEPFLGSDAARTSAVS